MSDHTPGPWEWWTSNSWRRLRHSERGVSTNILMPMVCRDGQPDIDVSAADMKLIAASPDLLAAARAALNEMVNTVAQRNSFTDAVDLLDAAITKASGS